MVLSALSGSLWADILSDYMSRVRPSYACYIYASIDGSSDYNTPYYKSAESGGVKVDSCFVYQSNAYCKTATVTINGL